MLWINVYFGLAIDCVLMRSLPGFARSAQPFLGGYCFGDDVGVSFSCRVARSVDVVCRCTNFSPVVMNDASCCWQVVLS